MPSFTLVLVRHAEASMLASSDQDRELTLNGLEQATALGRTLSNILGACDLAIVSSAVRAKQTFEGIQQSLSVKSIHFEPRLYVANSEAEFSAILKSHLTSESPTVLVVGHNPVISTSATIYTGVSAQFAPAEFLALRQNASSWEIALNSDGCWEQVTQPSKY